MSNPRMLLISYHFPPILGSSGFLRPLSWAKFLPDYGLDVDVLTVRDYVYPAADQANAKTPHERGHVYRSFAADAQRHLSWRGKFLDASAFPDRWSSWYLSGVPHALALSLRNRYSCIATTYPIATAHLIGLTLKKLLRKPWIADFRDPMLLDDFPAPGRLRRFHAKIERKVIERADLVTVTTPGTRRLFVERYGDAYADKIIVIENGVDLAVAEHFETDAPPPDRPEFVGVHSGIVYPADRDPTNLFGALADIDPALRARTRLEFRASGHDDMLEERSTAAGVADRIAYTPPLPHAASLRALMEADYLLLLQAESCNNQIPAKVYEYLLSGKPILALADPQGDTGRLLESCASPYVAKLEDRGAVAQTLERLLNDLEHGRAQGTPRSTALRFSREARARELAGEILSRTQSSG